MSRPKKKARTPRARNAPVVQIGGTDNAHTKAVLVILERVAIAATTNGREAIAVEAVKALALVGQVHGATLRDCTFTGL